MRILLISFFIFHFSLFTLPAPAQDTTSSSLRNQLESTYAAWRTAMIRKDFNAWSRATAAPRRAAVRNLILSQRKPFPRSLFLLPIKPPSLLSLKHLDSQTSSTATAAAGNTAVAIYYGKVDFSVTGLPPDQLRDHILVLHFIKETDPENGTAAWKFDRNRLVDLDPAPNIRDRVAANDIAFLRDPTFEPDRAIPPVPQPVAVPDYVARLDIISIGFKTRVRINNTHDSTVAQDGVSAIVIGGIRKGENSITIDTLPIDTVPADQKRFLVEVHVLRDDHRPPKPPARIFQFAPATANVPATHSAPVWANAVTIHD